MSTSTTTTPTLHFVVFYVSDLEQSLKFFTETLGLEHDPQQDAPDFRGFKVPAGALPFGLTPARKDAGAPRPGSIEVYFKTDNLEGSRSALLEEGVQTTEITDRYFGSIFGVSAPDGIQMTMIHPAGQ